MDDLMTTNAAEAAAAAAGRSTEEDECEHSTTNKNNVNVIVSTIKKKNCPCHSFCVEVKPYNKNLNQSFHYKVEKRIKL